MGLIWTLGDYSVLFIFNDVKRLLLVQWIFSKSYKVYSSIMMTWVNLVGIAGSPWYFVGFPWQFVGMQFAIKTYKIKVKWNKMRWIPDALIWYIALLTKFLEISFILALFAMLSQNTFVCRLRVFSVHFSVHEEHFNDGGSLIKLIFCQ